MSIEKFNPEVVPPHTEYDVARLEEYDEEVAVGIAALMPQLDGSFSGDLTDERRENYQYMIGSGDYELFAATREDPELGQTEVLGSFSLSLSRGAGFGRRYQLEDVVVAEHARGMGVGAELMQAMLDHCYSVGIETIYFQTEGTRPDALKLYEKMGARALPDEQTWAFNIESSKS